MINLPLQHFSESFKKNYISELIQYIKSPRRKTTTQLLKNFCHANSIDLDRFLAAIAINPFSKDNLSAFPFLRNYYELMKLRYRVEQIHDAAEVGSAIDDYLNLHQIQQTDLFYISTSNTINVLALRNSIDATLKTIKGPTGLNLERVFNYDGFFNSRAELKTEVAEESNIKVCPYCNRNFTDSYKYKSRTRSTAQLDHFYPKSLFPLYALSLANFVPACAYCNGVLKRDALKPLVYPYNQNNNQQPHFKIELKNADSLFGNSTSKVKISVHENSEFKDNAELFRHKEIYQNHKDHIQHLLKQSRHFSDKYQAMMQHSLGDNLGIKPLTKAQFRELLHGYNPEKEEELLTKPLSKLSHDFLKMIYGKKGS